jgi:hypothetical protein
MMRTTRYPIIFSIVVLLLLLNGPLNAQSGPKAFVGEQQEPGGQKGKAFRINASLNAAISQICGTANVFSELETDPIGSLFHKISGFRC